jgi:hypothetical protein
MGQQARLVFDHEQDTRPRRPVADWGGDEVFARTPRRRFNPVVVGTGEAHEAPRLDVAESVRPRLHVVPPLADVPAIEVQTAEFDVLAEMETTGVELAEPEAAFPEPEATFPEPEAAWEEERAPNGRRTVLITGRPGAHPAPRHEAVATRRRPPRTVEERLGARPDRVAAWACGLGVTLILAAVATADAATRGL